MTMTRREMIRRGTITAAVAAVPVVANAMTPVLDPEALEVARVFMLLNDHKRALLHNTARSFAGLGFDPVVWERHDDKPLASYGEGAS